MAKPSSRPFQAESIDSEFDPVSQTEHFRHITFHKNVKAETDPLTGEVTLILPASPMPEEAIKHIKGLATLLRIPIRVIEEMVDEQCLFQLFKDHQK